MTDAAKPSWRRVWIDLLLYPSHTLPTAAAPVAVAVGLAIHDHVFMPLPALLAFLASWLVHTGGIFVDNYQLVFDHPDVPEHPELLQGLADGTLTPRSLRFAIGLSFLGAALAGVWLVPIAGLPAVILGVIGVVASVGYAVGPAPQVKHGVAEPVFFVMFGIVAVAGAYYVQAIAARGIAPGWLPAMQALPPPVFVIGLPVGALVAAILVIDDIRDAAFDAAKGWRTNAVRFGRGWSRAEFTALVVFAYATPVWFWLGLGFGPQILLPLLTAPMAVYITHAVRTYDRRDDLIPFTPRASLLSLAFAVLLAIGVAWS